MSERMIRNIKAFILGMILGGCALTVTLTMPGCGTVSGIGSDLQRASDGMRNAMTQE